MKRVVLIGLFVFICSCTAIGKYTSLEINSSLWKPKENQSGNEKIFIYKCQENYSFEVKKIIGTENQIYVIGPIIPFIPVIFPLRSYDNKFEITVVGIIQPIRKNLEKANFYISNDGSNFISVNTSVTVETVEGFSHIEFNRAKITVNLPVNNKFPEHIRVHSDLEINGCKIPDIEYKTEVENYAGFKIPHMGP